MSDTGRDKNRKDIYAPDEYQASRSIEKHVIRDRSIVLHRLLTSLT